MSHVDKHVGSQWTATSCLWWFSRGASGEAGNSVSPTAPAEVWALSPVCFLCEHMSLACEVDLVMPLFAQQF